MLIKNNQDLEWLKHKENRLLFELYIAYLTARVHGKRKTKDEHDFEVNDIENLINLRNTILAHSYRPSRGTVHVIFKPVIREIFAAPFRDRIVHHWIYLNIYDWWDRRFIYDSYSCRENKGTLFGIKRLQKHIQQASDNGKIKTYAIKMDIRGYFMSISRQKLLTTVTSGLEKQFKNNREWRYQALRHVITEIIMDEPCHNVNKIGWPFDWENVPKSKSLFRQPPGVGIVIGNLTSQLFSNIFLDKLNRFIRFDLGYEHYGRYVDDFYLIVTEGQLSKTLKDVERIRVFLQGIGLKLHKRKFSVQPVTNGVEFLGTVVYPRRTHPAKRVKTNARQAFREVAWGIRDTETVVSYMGHMKHIKSYKFIKELFDENGWDYS